MPPSSMMIMVAGPYRSGTQDDPQRMAANVSAMEAYALPLFRAGHIPIVGEWLACQWSRWRAAALSAMNPSTKSSTP